MTLLDLANFICSKAEKTDAASLARVKSLLQARWKLIWEYHPWRLTKAFASITVAPGTQAYLLPEDCAHVLAVRFGPDRELAPQEVETLLRRDAVGWDAAGEPYGYSVEASGTRQQLRLFRTPERAATLLVIYKKVCPVLGDNTHPILQGADTALLAWGEADFLEARRQYGKAQLKLQEAGALTDKMRQDELLQSATTRQFIPEDGGWPASVDDAWSGGKGDFL